MLLSFYPAAMLQHK